MHIKVLGTGCKKCETLKSNVEETIKELGLEATIEKVEDFNVIIGYGVMNTPALVIDEKVVSKGKVLKVKDLKKILA
jgi:small redox-active disulfide protein 2